VGISKTHGMDRQASPLLLATRKDLRSMGACVIAVSFSRKGLLADVLGNHSLKDGGFVALDLYTLDSPMFNVYNVNIDVDIVNKCKR
jgi:hypothetical protein